MRNEKMRLSRVLYNQAKSLLYPFNLFDLCAILFKLRVSREKQRISKRDKEKRGFLEGRIRETADAWLRYAFTSFRESGESRESRGIMLLRDMR
jgi:hypothetical protein